ncbi:3-ketoacyl-ACP reductase [Bacillus coahuilensis m2-6]|uniref:elongation factor P 5-aminopentanone reductase n=1 Tax=Bacillus coahuilensis TaxID=408580 RepID=UPI0001850D96|nr:SDR family oxidoreductase [Bacillus coahuilensis]KUP08438.1 3-ketoacyl-ACP reductase [Bacillus coahuilensis m2-6]
MNDQKFALILGASGGIGKATALRLGKEGWSLYLHYHQNEEAVIEIINALKDEQIECIPLQCDLLEEEAIEKIEHSIFSIDSLIYTSGTSSYGLLQDISQTEIKNQMKLHLEQPILLTQRLLPKLLQTKGSIVYVSSIWGETGASFETVYSAAKGGQIAFMKALAKEVGPSGVTVNCVAPGVVNTTMMGSFSEDERQSMVEEIPLGRFCHPHEVAGSISFLLSKDAKYITGHVLSINGGWHM